MNAREQLALAYQICAHRGWDNWTYTHISLRIKDNMFLINPFGSLYQSVTPENLIEINMDNDPEFYFGKANPTGVLLHSAVYQKRPDINAIFHLHTSHGVAVSSMKCGLLPISQFALHFYGKISTHAYDSLILDEVQQCEKVAHDLGDNYTMLLQNHGTLTAGRTLHEAFFFTHHLEEACRVQCLAMSANTPLIVPEPHICQKAHEDLMSFESDRGIRDWMAAMSLVNS